jgi:hypothetical protein
MQAWQIAPPCQHICDCWLVLDPCCCQLVIIVSDGLLILPLTSCLSFFFSFSFSCFFSFFFSFFFSCVAVHAISHSSAKCANAAIARGVAVHKHTKLPPMFATLSSVRL